MNISDEAVEAAANTAAHHLYCYTLPANFNGGHEYFEEVADRCGPMIARAVLEAAAPYLMAAVLEDAAEHVIVPGASSIAAEWLRARAEAYRAAGAGE